MHCVYCSAKKIIRILLSSDSLLRTETEHNVVSSPALFLPCRLHSSKSYTWISNSFQLDFRQSNQPSKPIFNQKYQLLSEPLYQEHEGLSGLLLSPSHRGLKSQEDYANPTTGIACEHRPFWGLFWVRNWPWSQVRPVPALYKWCWSKSTWNLMKVPVAKVSLKGKIQEIVAVPSS